jgi:hypothetical protein
MFGTSMPGRADQVEALLDDVERVHRDGERERNLQRHEYRPGRAAAH